MTGDRVRLTRRALLSGTAALAGGALLARCNFANGEDPVPTADVVASPSPAIVAVEGYSDPERWSGREIVVASPGDDGGAYQAAQIEAIFEPFQRLTGATVRAVRTDLDELRRQVNQGEVLWSVCDVPADEVLPLANAGIIAAIDYARIDSATLFPGLRMDHGVGASLFATVLSYRTDAWDEPIQPNNWSDCWDLETFPGLRGFQESPVGTLEFALLADGVEIFDLYPLDTDRAFQKLERIREHVVLWWRQGAQPTQMVAVGDVQIVSAWHNRILGLRDEGAAVDFQWRGSAVNGDSWVIPNGAPEPDVALDFINFATRPEVCAAFSRLFPFGPTNRQAFSLLDDDLADHLPDAPGHRGEQFTINFDWWFRNREVVQTEFDEWLAEEPPGG